MWYRVNKDFESMQTKISVIIPVYKVEKYLDRCVNSVLNQTLKDIEVILIDDGSPDGCPAMCEEYKKKDNRVRVIHKENGGLGYARNSGLEIATGEYIAFVDSDDFIEEDMYESLYSDAIKYNADVVFSNVKFYKDGKTTTREDVEEQTVFSGKEAVKSFLLDMVAPLPNECRDVKYMVSVWRALYRFDIIKTHFIRFFSEREIVSEDLPFNIEFLKYSENIVYSDKAFYNYCYNSVSLSKTASFEKYDKMVGLVKLIKSQLEELFSYSVYSLYYYRYVLFVLRISLLGDLRICREQNMNWRQQFRRRCSNEVYAEVLAAYPMGKMPLKFRLFYGFIRNGFSFAVKGMLMLLEGKRL